MECLNVCFWFNETYERINWKQKELQKNFPHACWQTLINFSDKGAKVRHAYAIQSEFINFE